MENKKQVTGGRSHDSSSSMTLDHLFGPKDSSSASSSSSAGLFGSIFPPVPSTGLGRERKQDFGNGKYGSTSYVDNKNQGYYSRGESMNGITSKDSLMYQNDEAAVEPCNLSSSIYYGGQENYSPRTRTSTESHQPHIAKKDGVDDDPNGNSSASRGNWWQGSLYY